MNTETKQCQNCKSDFIIEPEDFAFYEKIKVPPPTWCPECREIRRICWRNERSLYNHKCDLCGKSVISRVSPDKPYPMYCKNCWWSDKWDAIGYGREYDFGRPFFEQYRDLLNVTPHVSIFNANVVNSDWVNQETDDKNCYLNVGGHYNEDSAYNTYSIHGRDIYDSYWVLNSELCYGGINLERCSKTHYSRECVNCVETFFSSDCHNCMNVIGCAGLRNKQYCIWNEQVTKEEYLGFLANNPLGSRQVVAQLQKKASEVWQKTPKRYAYIFKSPGSTGNFVNECREVKNCWNVEKTEIAKHLYIAGWLRDCHDETSHGASELCYECASGGGVYASKFLNFCMSNNPLGGAMHSTYLEYCFATVTCNNCFGCANLRNKEYCILNKQYTKEEYETVVSKIKEQMSTMPYLDKKGRVYGYGEFFPPDLSPFGYNETAAVDFYPLTKTEALDKAFIWSDATSGAVYEFSDYVIPDNINDVGDDILTKILRCGRSGKAYRIIKQELEFYRRMNLPVPTLSPLERHKDRMSALLPRRLYSRNCDRCKTAMESPYAPDRSEIIYCEKCYQAEVV